MPEAPPPLPPLPTPRPLAPDEAGLTCAICQSALAPGEVVAPCPACGAPFHRDCWAENGGCATYGCAVMPAAVAAPALPPSVWGQEDRDCPRCGGRIKMAARRCLHCGAALPEVAAEPATDGGVRPAPSTGAAILVFAAAVLPPTAPLTLLAGGLWLRARRRELARWPHAVRLLLIAAVVAAAAVTLVTLAGLAVHLGRRPPSLD